MSQMAQTTKAFGALDSAASKFADTAQNMNAMGSNMLAWAAPMLAPLLKVKGAMADTGMFFERIKVQIESLTGHNKKAADSLYNFTARMAVDLPDSFRDSLTVMREFKFLGIDVQKTFGNMVIDVGGKLQTLPKTALNALSGMAAAVGTSMTIVGHHVATAIKTGQAQHLEYYIGPLRMMELQMSGAFVGTFQQKFDKTMKWMSNNFSLTSAKLARTFTGIMNNMKDGMDQLKVSMLGIGLTRGPLADLRGSLALIIMEFNKIMLGQGQDPKDALINKVGAVFQDIYAPAITLATRASDRLLTSVSGLMKRFGDPSFRSFLVLWGQRIGLAGAILGAAGALAIFSAGMILAFKGMALFFAPLISTIAVIVPLLALLSVGADTFFTAYGKGFGSMKGFVVDTLRFIYGKMEAFASFFVVLSDIWITNSASGMARVKTANWKQLSDTQKWLAHKWHELVNDGFSADTFARVATKINHALAEAIKSGLKNAFSSVAEWVQANQGNLLKGVGVLLGIGVAATMGKALFGGIRGMVSGRGVTAGLASAAGQPLGSPYNPMYVKIVGGGLGGSSTAGAVVGGTLGAKMMTMMRPIILSISLFIGSLAASLGTTIAGLAGAIIGPLIAGLLAGTALKNLLNKSRAYRDIGGYAGAENYRSQAAARVEAEMHLRKVMEAKSVPVLGGGPKALPGSDMTPTQTIQNDFGGITIELHGVQDPNELARLLEPELEKILADNLSRAGVR